MSQATYIRTSRDTCGRLCVLITSSDVQVLAVNYFIENILFPTKPKPKGIIIVYVF